jgi:hypothetical protein
VLVKHFEPPDAGTADLGTGWDKPTVRPAAEGFGVYGVDFSRLRDPNEPIRHGVVVGHAVSIVWVLVNSRGMGDYFRILVP